MSYGFKKLSEVQAMDVVPEGAKVLAEANGQIVRVPGSGLGGSGGVMLVNFAQSSDGKSVTADKTFEEIKYATSSGCVIIARLAIFYIPLFALIEGSCLTFSSVFFAKGINPIAYSVEYYQDGRIVVSQAELTVSTGTP